jgi:hypothetical protein
MNSSQNLETGGDRVCFTRELISGLSSVNKLDFEEVEKEREREKEKLNQCPFRRILTAIFGSSVSQCLLG